MPPVVIANPVLNFPYSEPRRLFHFSDERSESTIHDLGELRTKRQQETGFLLSKFVLERFFKDDGGAVKPWLFAQVLVIVRRWMRDRVRLNEMLNLIVEVCGRPERDNGAKLATTCTLWVPAIDNYGGLRHWAFLGVTDPWATKNTLRALVDEESVS